MNWIAAVIARFICRVQDAMDNIRRKEIAIGWKAIPQTQFHGAVGVGTGPGLGRPIDSTTAGEMVKSAQMRRPEIGVMRASDHE